MTPRILMPIVTIHPTKFSSLEWLEHGNHRYLKNLGHGPHFLRTRGGYDPRNLPLGLTIYSIYCAKFDDSNVILCHLGVESLSRGDYLPDDWLAKKHRYTSQHYCHQCVGIHG